MNETLLSPSTAGTSHWDRMYEGAVRSAWTQNPLIAAEVYQRMTGQPGFWMEWVFTQAMPSVDRLLSIGCGDGGHEIAMARRGFVREIRAFDASPVAIEQARTSAFAEGLEIDFAIGTFEAFVQDSGPEDLYDAVLFSGSLHHVLDLEGMLSAVRRVLKPGGRVIVNEYCGPCYQLYSAGQLEVINRVLSSIPETFRLGPQIQLELPTIEMIMAGDPTEGVRASLIPLLVPMYFRKEYERFIGGALLHPIFGCLNGAKVNDGSPESIAFVQMLILLENELTAAGRLGHEFMFGIYVNA